MPAALVEYDFVENLFFVKEVLERIVAEVGWLRGKRVADGPVLVVLFNEVSDDILLSND